MTKQLTIKLKQCKIMLMRKLENWKFYDTKIKNQ